mmetsp:Transcript_8807/g.18274  ORF Transcript_8807/g.18274 Transcript_8807/m.18274 type:complete len:416 (+) Transcript_8807:433-1680(+)
MSSSPLRRQCLRNASTSKEMVSPLGRRMVCVGRSTVSSAPASASAIRVRTCSSGSLMGSMPFLKLLLKKMSAKEGAMMQRMPKSFSAHGACSREDPHPKLSPATRTEVERYWGLLSTKSGFSSPSGVYRISLKSATPSPVRLIVFRYCFGMIMSVSMFIRSSAAAVPVSVVKGVMPPVAAGAAAAGAASTGGRWRMSVRVPVMAAAAAMTGDIRWVRPPLPWRPSKLRLEVEAQRWPGSSLSGFMARHMEHPGSRQSKPASMRTVCRPSSSASSFTRPEPGTTIACTPAATLRPLAMRATSRMSSMRPLVHEPMNTLEMGVPSRAWPGVRPMYSSARSSFAFTWGLDSAAGSGTVAVMGRASSGEVPHVMVGAMAAASTTISLSYCDPASEGSVFQYSTAMSNSSPKGAMGRPRR